MRYNVLVIRNVKLKGGENLSKPIDEHVLDLIERLAMAQFYYKYAFGTIEKDIYSNEIENIRKELGNLKDYEW